MPAAAFQTPLVERSIKAQYKVHTDFVIFSKK